tara:strand:+ start:31076 stop:31912 length:837 start_codon:yes stop_codon:yes gene_type:complete
VADYDAEEVSVEDGQPVELYEFTLGAQTFRYTSSEDTILLGATTYTPKPIRRGKIEDGPQKRNVDFQAILPTSDPLAQEFLGVLPGVRVPLTVSRYHRGDTGGGGPEVVTIFTGFVLSANFAKKGKECRLTARHALANLGRIIPSRSFASACGHILYNPATCKADDTSPANRISVDPVVSQVGNLMTVTSIVSGGFADGQFNSGFVEAAGSADFRLILAQTGNVLTLLQPFTTAPATVNIFRGCGHTIEACKNDHDNVLNYGGFAFVPSRNPYSSGVL